MSLPARYRPEVQRSWQPVVAQVRGCYSLTLRPMLSFVIPVVRPKIAS